MASAPHPLRFEELELERVPPARAGTLAAAALARELAVPGFLVAREASSIEPLPAAGAHAERFERARRTALAARLEGCLAPQRPHVAVLDAIRALRDAQACAVVTGQQPGLLASPLLTLYKALQALRLARRLTQAWERPVVAIFWNHADDHDIAEVHHAHLQNENLDLQRVGLAGVSSGRQPVGRVVLDDARNGLSALRGLLEQSLARRTTDPQQRQVAERAIETMMPREGETLASAFTRALTGLLGHLGLIVLEPEWIREEMSRALEDVVGCDLAARLEEGARAVRAAGFDPAIDPSQAALLYHLDDRGRTALRAGGEGFVLDGEGGSRTPFELQAQIVSDLRTWSPGALTRPVVQDMCLPVVAYVGGPGELAYHAQLVPLRRALEVPLTPFVPRRSCTLLEPEAALALEKLGLDVAGVLSGELERLGRESAELARPQALEKLRAAGERARAALLEPRAEVAAFDRALAQNLARTADQVQALVDRLLAKGDRVHQNSAGKGRRHIRRVENALLPRGEWQERVLGPISFLARFGRDWIDALHGRLDPFDARHLVLSFEPSASDRAGLAAGADEDSGDARRAGRGGDRSDDQGGGEAEEGDDAPPAREPRQP